MNAETDRPRLAVCALTVVVLVLIACSWAMRGPAPRASTTPAAEFSAARARVELTRVMRADVPRPLGSAEHEASRARIAARFQELGYTTEIQSTFTCGKNGTCAQVQNIVARREGKQDGPGVLAVSHYDSVPAGPGASDAAAGVAAMLEVARAISLEQSPRRITFLITDGEEAGLLGARAFVAEPRLRSLADVVVNLENRGTAGPSLMFETSRNNLRLIEAAGAALKRPVSSSLFVMIYDLLPNDTDLTVFKKAGMSGVNLAAIRDPWAYHTPLDAMQRVNLRTLQHHGDNVLALVRTFASGPTPVASGNAVHFDLLSLRVVSWPARYSLPFAITMLLASMVFLLLRIRRAGPSLLVLPLTILAAAGVAALLIVIALIRAGPISWIATPSPVLAAIWLAAIAVAAIVAQKAIRWSDSAANVAAVSTWWAVLAIVTSQFLPGASYLFIVPGFVVLIASAAYTRHRAGGDILSIVATLAAALLWLPMSLVLYEGLATPALLATAVVVAIVISPSAHLLPGVGDRAPSIALSIAFSLAIVMVFVQPATKVRPRPLNLTLVAIEGEPTRWLASAVTSDLKQTTPFDTRPRAILPWAPGTSGYVGNAAEFDLPLPEVTVASGPGPDGATVHRIDARPTHAANRMSIWCRSAAPLVVSANGVVAGSRKASTGQWTHASVVAPRASFEVRSAAGVAIELYVTETTFGLPAAAARVADARRRSAGVPIQDGDVTIAARRIVLK